MAKAGGAAEPKKPAAKLPKASDADVAGFKAAYEAHIAERALNRPPITMHIAINLSLRFAVVTSIFKESAK